MKYYTGSIRIVIAIISIIIAVGCISGPTGYESENWVGMGIFALIGILSARSAFKAQGII